MTKGIRGGVLATLVGCAVLAPAATAAPVTVQVRVEGATQTIFDGPVTTDVHQITTPSDGRPRLCDGTNVGSTSGPSAIGALDDAARAAGFSWDARWDDSFGDYYPFVRVGTDDIDQSHYPALYVNWAFAQLGGCGQRVNEGDEVLWAYDDFNASPLLRLSGPSSATTAQSVQVKVVNGLDGTPQEGATVAGAPTGPDGRAAVSFGEPGIYRLKAEKPDAIRSNALVVCVDPPDADPCSSSDKAAPSVRWRLPGRLASEGGRSRAILVSWDADDGTGSGVAHYSIDVRELARGAAPGQPATEWRSLLGRAPVNGLHFRGEAGDAYQFRITAVDRAANRAVVETDPVVIPVDDRSRRLWRFSRHWDRTPAGTAWGGTVVRTRRAGATADLRFRGTRVALIGRKLPKGGRLRVAVGGRSRTLRLRGRSAPRGVLWTSRRLRSGTHSLALRTLGGGPVELDAVAPLP